LTISIIKDIRLRKRNNKKTITTVEGIPEEFDFDKILRYWKKVPIITIIVEFQLHRNHCVSRRRRRCLVLSPTHRRSQKWNCQISRRRRNRSKRQYQAPRYLKSKPFILQITKPISSYLIFIKAHTIFYLPHLFLTLHFLQSLLQLNIIFYIIPIRPIKLD
jgi:hypothetical protein